MNPKQVLQAAKAKIATRETWCQGNMALRRAKVGEVDDPRDAWIEVSPSNPEACKWCLDGALRWALGQDGVGVDSSLYHESAGFLNNCSTKLFETTDWVAINDGDSGLTNDVHYASDPDIGVQAAFENAHKVLDCAIECATE